MSEETPQPPPAETAWVAPRLPARQPSPFRSAATRARWVVRLLIATAGLMVASVAISLWGKSTITAFEAGDATLSDLELFDGVFALSGLISLIVYVPTVIAWLAWSSRTVDNEDPLGIGPSTISPRWAMGWWFVPFAT
jgi:hypothetical protein